MTKLQRVKFSVPQIKSELTLEVSVGKDENGNLYWIPLNHLHPELRSVALEIYNRESKGVRVNRNEARR
jgi:hypothetical protein